MLSITSLIILSITVNAPETLADVFTSVQHMVSLYRRESRLLDELDTAIHFFKETLHTLVQTRSRLSAWRGRRARENARGVAFAPDHPVDAFTLVRRLARDWPLAVSLMTHSYQLPKDLMDEMNEGETEMGSALRGLNRLQTVYRLATDQLADGIVGTAKANTTMTELPSPACHLIRYSPWDEVYSADLGVLWAPLEFTPTFVSKMRFSMPFAAVSLVLTLLASMFAMMGHCSADHKTLVACGLYTLAGLSLASGLVVFVAVLSDAYLERPRRGSAFHYRYGWSFFTAGVAFVLAEAAALLSMTAYLKRFPTVEDMVRAMVPGADRRLQERQLCKELLVAPRDSADAEGTKEEADASDQDGLGLDGPLMSKTPPDICATQPPPPLPVADTVPITLMHPHSRRAPQTSPLHFHFPSATLPRSGACVCRFSPAGSCTVLHQGALGAVEVNSSSSGSSASSAGIVTSSGSSSSSRTFQSLPRTRRHSAALAGSKRSDSPSSGSQGYCSGGQPIVIHSDEEIV